MAWTKNIDITKPPDTGESPSLGASRIRDWKNAVCERLTNWIYSFKTDDSETKEGLKKAPLNTGSAPTQEADKIIVYAKDVAGVAELFARDENGNEIQLTSNGKLLLSDGCVTTPKIVDGNVTQAKIATGGVGTNQIADGAVTGAKFANNTVTIDKLKLSIGSYSESIPASSNGSLFETNPYAHQAQFKGVSGAYIHVGQDDHHFWDWIPGTSWEYMKYRMYNTGSQAYTAYAQWVYHSSSKQAIWGVWDKDQKRLTCVLIEEDEGFCKLFPTLRANQILVKFKNPEKFLKQNFDSQIDKVENLNEKKAKIKDKTFAGYILEDIQVTEEDIEEIEKT